MKRRFTRILAALVLLLFVAPPMIGWGQTRSAETFSYTAYAEQGTSGTGSPCSANQNGITIASTKAYCSTNHVKEYSGSQLTISSTDNTITSIAITFSGTSYADKFTLPTTQPGSYSVSGSVGTWNGTANVITLENTASAQARWTQIVVTYSGGSTPSTYTVIVTQSTGGTISATPTSAAAGTTITLTATPTEGYSFDSWSITPNTVEIINNQFTMPASNVTVSASWTQNSGGGATSPATLTQSNLGLTGAYTTGTEKTINGITYVYTDLMKNNDNIQAKASTGTIKNTTAYPGDITSVVITHSGTARATTINGSADGENWNQVATGSGSITANFSGKGYKYFQITRGSNAAYWESIVITWSEGGSSLQQSDLTITNESTDLTFDLYNNSTAQVINYSTSSMGAITITPAESDYFSYVHDAAAKTITVTPTAVTPSAQTVTINQAADDDYYAGTATFTVSVANSDPNLPGTQNNPYTVAQARAAINAGTGTQGVYATGIVSSIETAWSTQYSNITFNFVDNAGDTDFLQAFRCVSGTGVDASTVAVGDIVVVHGNLTKYGSIYEFGQGCELVSLIHSAVPSITVNPDEVNVDATPAAGEDFIEGTLDLTWENLEITDFFEDFAIQYYDAEGEELADDPNWIMVDLATQDPNIGEGYLVSYMIEENEGTEARTAYFKVFALGDEDYVYSNMVTVNQAAPVVPPTPGNWVLTNLADLTEDDIFVIVGTDADDDTFALPNDGGASTAPSATAITIVEGTISGEPAEELQWNLSGNATDGYTFYPNGETETWLYCTNTNNGVRVGTNDNKIFKMDEGGYLVNDATTRVLSIYVNNGTPQDWRCYSNYNNNPVVISFYKKIETHTIQYSVNGVIIDALQQTSPTLVPSSLEEYESYVPNGYYFKGWIEGEEISLTQEEPNIISDIELYNPTADVTLKAVFAICDYDAINCSNYCTRAYPINGRLTNEITETDKAYYVDRGELGDQGAFVARNDVVTINGALGNFDPNALSIQQGGELIVNNAVSVQMNEWVNGNSWCFIASPLIDEVPAENIGAFGSYSHQTYNTEDPKYNLYFYDEPTHWWRSYQNGIYAGFNIEPGTGYLYSVEQDGDQDFQYVGLIQPYVEDGIAIDLNYTATIDGEENPLAGWNLVGNPFPFTTTIDKSFYYVINNTITPAEEGTLVGPCTGAFVRAQTTGETVTFTKAENMGKSSSIGISVVGETMRGNSWANVDKAIVSFSGSQLEKFVFDADNAKLYIPQNGMDYAIVSTEAQGELPVNFRANKNGTFTLSMDVENMDMNYLHLIDNMTGMDVDLLQTPSYTFEAKVNDYESRFRLVFAANNEDGASTGSATFAFYSNGNWIINNAGEATLQVVDLTGRILSSETVNGSVSKTINAVPGVYMLRLINGDNVNVQKIVVR